jgi:transposase
MEKITPTVTRPRKVNYKEAKIFIEKNPDKTLKEIGVAIGTKDALYVIKKLGITYKKNASYTRKGGKI